MRISGFQSIGRLPKSRNFLGKILLLGAMCALSSACVSSPHELNPVFLRSSELALLTHVSKGQDLARGGRLLLSEAEYRKALLLSGELPSLYNNLGYVLSAQGRFQEAVENFDKALVLLPGFVDAGLNRAIALYRSGYYEAARSQYQQLLDQNFAEEIRSSSNPERRTLTAYEFSLLYRNISLIDFSLGLYDDSVCSSKMAVAYEFSSFQFAQHIRLLFAEGRVDSALAVLRQFVESRRDRVPPQLMLDYGVALIAMKQDALARAALGRVLSYQVDQNNARLNAKLLLFVLGGDGQSVEEMEIREKEISLWLEEEPALCQSEFDVEKRYWPDDVLAGALNFVERYCVTDDHRARG